MDIVLILETGGVKGGAEKVAFQSAQELQKLGHKVWLITAAKEVETDFAEVLEGWLALDEKSFYSETDRSRKVKKLFGNPFVVGPVSAFLRKFDPANTIVHAHTYRLNLSGLVMKTAQDLGFKTVQTCHEYSIACPTSLFYDYRLEQICHRKPLSAQCITCECTGTPYRYKLPRLASAWANKNLYRIPNRVNGYIHVSQLAKDRLESAIGRYGEHVIIPNPQEISDSLPAEVGSFERFIYIGRLTKEKAPDVFCEACKRAQVPGMVVGDGPMLKELKEKYPAIEFTGWLSSSGVIRNLRESRGYVMPSAWEETFGLSVVDAMSNGVPTIVASNIGATDWINQEKDGIVIERNDVDDFAEAMRSLSPEKAATLGRAAYDKVKLDPPTPHRHVERLLHFYNTLIVGRSVS